MRAPQRKRRVRARTVVLALSALALAITALAWRAHAPAPPPPTHTDTRPAPPPKAQRVVLRGEDVALRVSRAPVGATGVPYACATLDFWPDAKRDWGHARDYVEGMWLMVQRDVPDDYVLATGECHSVREFVEVSFEHVGVKIKWVGEAGTADEVGVDASDESRVLVKIDPKYYRPTEVDLLVGDAAKARRDLGWKPKITFKALATEMVDADMAELESELASTRQ